MDVMSSSPPAPPAKGTHKTHITYRRRRLALLQVAQDVPARLPRVFKPRHLQPQQLLHLAHPDRKRRGGGESDHKAGGKGVRNGTEPQEAQGGEEEA